MKFQLTSLLLALPTSHALVATPIPTSTRYRSPTSSVASTSATDTTTTSPWRVALNIGREPFTTMPLDWASSGCRLPLVIKCDFNSNGEIVPQDQFCRFTGPDGQVIKPINKGTWKLEKDRNLEFSLAFPEDLKRRDVTIDAGTEIVCSGIMYSKDDLKEMNNRFYEAREKTWKAGEELNEISRRKEAPLKWDSQQNKWVKRYEEEPLWSQLGKQINLLATQAQSKRSNMDRPNPKTLSLESGPFPGVDSDVFMKKEGVIKIKKGWREAVIGTWSAEPINNNPASYRS